MTLDVSGRFNELSRFDYVLPGSSMKHSPIKDVCRCLVHESSGGWRCLVWSVDMAGGVSHFTSAPWLVRCLEGACKVLIWC